MLQLISLEVCNSVFDTSKENNTFEKPKAIEEIEKCYSLEDLKTDGENFRPEDFEDETLKPNTTVEIIKIEFDDIKNLRKILHLTEEEIKFSIGSNEAEDSV